MSEQKITVENTVTEEELKKIEEARKQFYAENNIEAESENSADENAMVKQIMDRVRERKKQLKSLSKNDLIKGIIQYELQLEQIQLLQNLQKEQNEKANLTSDDNASDDITSSKQDSPDNE